MKAIVTGGAGFIGSHVARICVERGWDTLVIDDMSGGRESNVPAGAQLSVMSITSKNIEGEFQRFRPDVVFHLAAYAAEGLSHFIPTFNYVNNIVGTSNVLSAGAKAGMKHFVFTSSIASYGHPNSERPFNENDPLVPIDPYGVAKKACEEHIRVFHEMHKGFNYTIFRPHNVFGPNQNISDPYRNVVGIFMKQFMKQENLSIFGDGNQTRSFSFIDVVAHAIVNSVDNREAINKTINIGGDQPMSVNELSALITKEFGSRMTSSSQVMYLPARHEAKHAHCDHTLARSVFKNIYDRYDMSIEQGISKMADWVISTGIPPVTECPSRIEIHEGLPDFWKRNLSNV